MPINPPRETKPAEKAALKVAAARRSIGPLQAILPIVLTVVACAVPNVVLGTALVALAAGIAMLPARR